MSYYRICPHCGAHLDPGERCDCAASNFQPSGILPSRTTGCLSGGLTGQIVVTGLAYHNANCQEILPAPYRSHACVKTVWPVCGNSKIQLSAVATVWREE